MADFLEFFCDSCGEHLRVPGTTSPERSVKCPYCDSVASLPKTAVLTSSVETNEESNPEPSSFEMPPRHRVSSTECVRDAVRLFGANFLLFGIGYLVVSSLDGSPGILVDGDEITFGFSTTVLTLISMFLSIGLIRAALHVARGGQADVEMVVSGVPYFGRVLLGHILFWCLTVVGFICLIVPGIYVLLTYWSFSHFIVDQNCDVVESFRRARLHSVGNRFATLRLAILSAVILLLGLMCFVVGLVVAIPVVSLMWTAAYLAMTGQSVNVANPQPQRMVVA